MGFDRSPSSSLYPTLTPAALAPLSESSALAPRCVQRWFLFASKRWFLFASKRWFLFASKRFVALALFVLQQAAAAAEGLAQSLLVVSVRNPEMK